MSLNVFFQGVPWIKYNYQPTGGWERCPNLTSPPTDIYIYFICWWNPLPLTLVFMQQNDAQDVLCESLLLPSLQCPVAPHRDCRVGTSGPFELSWVFLQMMHWMTASPNAWGLTFFQTKPVKNYGLMSNAIFLEAAATWNKTRHFECVVIGGFSSIFYGCCWSASGRPPTSFLSTGILPWTLGM